MFVEKPPVTLEEVFYRGFFSHSPPPQPSPTHRFGVWSTSCCSGLSDEWTTLSEVVEGEGPCRPGGPDSGGPGPLDRAAESGGQSGVIPLSLVGKMDPMNPLLRKRWSEMVRSDLHRGR